MPAQEVFGTRQPSAQIAARRRRALGCFWVRPRVLLWVLGLLALGGCSPLGSAPVLSPVEAPAKKVIHFGWHTPDVVALRERVAEFERVPFDGLVLDPVLPEPGGPIRLHASVFRRARTSPAGADPLIAALRAVPFRRFTDNFVRVNVTPGNIDWFDDWAAVLHNARLAARIAREGGLKGILLDTEQYEAPLFDYREQRDHGRRSYLNYAAQARRRGREVIQAINDAFPDSVLFLTFAYNTPELDISTWTELPESHYGLLPPFLDGLLEGAAPGTVVVDGFEQAYGFRGEFQFALARYLFQEWLSRRSRVPDRYRRHMRLAFGLWLDYQWRCTACYGWDPEDPSKNHFTPSRFREALRLALKYTDQYVWVYTEQPNWWTGERLHADYYDALREAQAGRRP